MCTFEFQTRTRLIFGEGAIDRLGRLARELGFRRPLLVADHGLQASGHVAEATISLAGAGIEPAGHDTAVCVELVEVHEPFIGSLLTFEPVVLSQ